MKRGIVFSAVLLLPMAVACWNTERDFGSPSNGGGGGAGGARGDGELVANPVPTEFVDEVSPAEDATQVASSASVVIQLTGSATGKVDVSVVGPSGDVAGETTLDGDTITFTPDDALSLLSDFTVLVSGEVEMDGETVELDFGWEFTTADGVWGEPVLIDALDTGVVTQSFLGFAGTPSGTAVAAWRQEVDGAPSVIGNVFTDGSWLGAKRLESTAATDIDSVSVGLSDGGDAVALWVAGRDTEPPDLLGAQFDPETGEWLAAVPTELTTSMPADLEYSFVMDGAGMLHLLWRGTDGYPSLSTMAPGSGEWGTRHVFGGSMLAQQDVGMSLAVHPNGDATVAWVRAYAWDYNESVHRADGTWSEPDKLAGNGSRALEVTPQLFGTDDDEYIVWTDQTRVWAQGRKDGSWDVSATPLSAALPEVDGVLATMPVKTISSEGVPVVAWWVDDGTRKTVQSSHFVDGEWQSAANVDEPTAAGCQNYLAADEPLVLEAAPNGDVFLGYFCSDGTTVEVWINRLHDGAWQGGERLGFSGYTEQSLRLGIDPQNRGLAAWPRCASSSCELTVSRFDGRDWAVADAVEELPGGISDIRIVARDNGSFLAVFNDTYGAEPDDLYGIEFAGR